MLHWNEWIAKQSRQSVAVAAMLGIVLIGIADYLAGNDVSLAVVYVFPIAIAAWYVGRTWAYALSLLSIVAWLAGDYAVGAGWVNAGFIVTIWNALIRLVFYYLIIHLLIKLHALTTGLETRVLQRTADLRLEMAKRERLQGELLAVAERERRRLGYDLHDGLCQHLTGTALAAQVLRSKLTKRDLPEGIEAAHIVDLIGEGIALARNVAKGLQPVNRENGGLMQALQEFAESTTEMFRISCKFECDAPVLISDFSVADHLYRIGQEATNNSVKHARATNIVIFLDVNEEWTVLRVEDDGMGMAQPVPENGGMGLRIMAERAKLIGAKFDIQSRPEGGTVINCWLPQAATDPNPRHA